MTLYYTIVFAVLIAEMLAFCLLVAPMPPKVHRKGIQMFRSPAFSKVILSLKFTFVFILVLFVDSVNRVSKVSYDFDNSTNLAVVDRGDLLARKFYAQRNMYLCGFTLFLSLILNRTYSMVRQLSDLRLRVTGEAGSKPEDSLAFSDLRAKYEKKKTDYTALKKQSEGLQQEYYRVCDELKAVQAKEDPKTK